MEHGFHGFGQDPRQSLLLSAALVVGSYGGKKTVTIHPTNGFSHFSFGKAEKSRSAVQRVFTR